MKLLRYGPKGHEKPGVLGEDGNIHDLSGVIGDLGGATCSLVTLDAIRDMDFQHFPEADAEDTHRIGQCLASVPTFHCIGLNYARHAAETGGKAPPEPILFSKAATALSGPYDPVIIPKDSRKSDWEVELGVVIGRETEHVSEADALSCVAGYCVVNDVSEREWQMERKGQWIKGKSAPTFAPIGPWMVTADEVPDPQSLNLWLKLNGETRQASSTSDMIFSVAELIAYMSRFMRLQPGDVIATGTPEGVGLGADPQRFLRPGDVMELGVEGLGEQRLDCVAWPG